MEQRDVAERQHPHWTLIYLLHLSWCLHNWLTSPSLLEGVADGKCRSKRRNRNCQICVVFSAASEREMRPLIKDCKWARSSKSRFYEKMKDRAKLLSIHWSSGWCLSRLHKTNHRRAFLQLPIQLYQRQTENHIHGWGQSFCASLAHAGLGMQGWRSCLWCSKAECVGGKQVDGCIPASFWS